MRSLVRKMLQKPDMNISTGLQAAEFLGPRNKLGCSLDLKTGKFGQ